MLGSLETGVQIIRESSCRCLGLNLGPVLLTAEPVLQPPRDLYTQTSSSLKKQVYHQYRTDRVIAFRPGAWGDTGTPEA